MVGFFINIACKGFFFEKGFQFVFMDLKIDASVEGCA